MNTAPNHQQTIDLAGDDHVVPFQVAELDVRGRAVQLGPMVNAILDGHGYPEPVSFLLAEAVCLSVLLGSSLKFDGRFIIQTESDGPVSFLVVDYKTPDAVRAYARFDQERLDALADQGKIDIQKLMGKGVLAMTIDQGANTQRYQGIVELDGQSLEEVAHQYFRQSEQIPTKVRLAVARLTQNDENGGTTSTLRAGGLIAQFLPDSPHRMRIPDLPGGDGSREEETGTWRDDAWTEAQSLVATIRDDELTDPQIGAERLLFRLFQERGVHVYPASRVINKCGCSEEKITAIINTFSASEREEALAASQKPGVISSKCEFCGEQYEIGVDEIS